MKTILFSIPLLLLTALLFLSSGGYHQSAGRNFSADTLIGKEFSKSPVLTAEESIKKMKLVDGFSVHIVAEEPLVNSPVALNFDNKGRIWVVEMKFYMPDTSGTGEEKPGGKIVILSDKNGDGKMDDRQVFLDSLVLPRALCLIENGILVAESPKLWFYEILNDKPVGKILVDASYAEGGNVEHQPNGLFRAMDNWIYNAKSGKRYRKKGDQWLIERTHFRGQWGITQDDQGRLFYNNNSENLQGDYFSPGFGAANENQQRVAGFSENIIRDNKVYPIRPTPGVNRGYMEGILDDKLRLVNFTAACGPLIFSSSLFGKEYYGNAFVAEPSANLIKRNILEEKGYQLVGEQAYTGKEFMTSKDERFRPVNLYNGPDGALYVVDMYRGIIQHRTYITGYLKDEIKKRALSQPTNRGRIYKIVPQNKKAANATIPRDPQKLVKLLQHPNGWVRDKAQQLLVDRKSMKVLPALRKLLKQTDNPLAAIHSLWTIEGLGALGSDDILPLLNRDDWHIRTQALSVLPSVMSRQGYGIYIAALDHMLEQKDSLAAPNIAFLVKSIQPFDPATANRIRKTVMTLYPKNIYVSDAVISSLQNRETEFAKEVAEFNPDPSLVIRQQLQKVLANVRNKENAKTTRTPERDFPRGAAMYKSTCQPCHGADGNGVISLAPPLNNSEWVTGDKGKFIPIELFGLSGPIKINGKVYKSPEINGDMPSIGQNKDFSDAEISQLLSFIRNSWNNTAENISAEEIGAIRHKFPGRQKSFIMEELNEIK